MLNLHSVQIIGSVCLALGACGGAKSAKDVVILSPKNGVEKTLDSSSSHRYGVKLQRGESAEVVVIQRGIDVVLELFSPDRVRIGSADAPVGRAGEERLDVIAEADGIYQVVVRPFDKTEPSGKYEITVMVVRDRTATKQRLAERAEARRLASAWLKERAGAVRQANGKVEGAGLERFDLLAKQARIIGIGEAAHGSCELADMRLALTRRLVEMHKVRLIALEGSAAVFRAVDAWARKRNARDDELPLLMGYGWINRRSFLALARYARKWNTAHPDDPLMIVGLDAQDNRLARDTLAAFAAKAFDSKYVDRISGVLKRLAAADAEAAVFGPSDVRAEDWQFLRQLLASFDVQQPLLAARYGDAPVQAVIAATRDLVQFAEFNSSAQETQSHSRDWMMAANILRAAGTKTRVVYLGHNLHVSHPSSKLGPTSPAGKILRELLGDEYAAISSSFLEGGFLAQMPNDPGDRLAQFKVSPAPPESLDAVLDSMGVGDAIVTWPKVEKGIPAWLSVPQPTHWIGALFSSDWLPHQRFRPGRVATEFDGVVFLRKVSAETVPEIGKNRAPKK